MGFGCLAEIGGFFEIHLYRIPGGNAAPFASETTQPGGTIREAKAKNQAGNQKTRIAYGNGLSPYLCIPALTLHDDRRFNFV